MSKLLDKRLVEECDRIGSGVADLLEQGADANAYDKYHSALGNAVRRMHIEAIEQLLSYGACVHWHDRQLLGIHKNPVDTLGIALQNFGIDFSAVIGDGFDPETTKDSEDVIAQELKVVLMLLKAGADVSLPDAATRKLPMETFCSGMDIWKQEMSADRAFKILSEGGVGASFRGLIEAVLNRSSQKNKIKSMILEGDWENLPEGWGELARFPTTHNIIHSFIQEKAMQTQTSPAKKTKSGLSRL